MEYLVVLVAGLFHAIWNSMIKDSDDKLLSLAALRAVGVLFGLTVIIFFPPLDAKATPYLIGGTLILFLYYWFLLNTYRVGDFSQAYPISRGGAPIIVLIMGAVFAGEYLSLAQIFATLIISSGILALSHSKGKLSTIPVIYALGTACCIAGYTVVNGLGARTTHPFIVYAGWLEILSGLPVLLLTFVKRKQKVIIYARTQWHQGLFAGILSVSGFAAALWAMTISPLGPVVAVRETGIIFAAIIGAFKLQESQGIYRISSACVVVIGIGVLVLFS